jgi:AraC-like DNA-binding protein
VRLCHALETIVEYPKDDFTRIALDLGFASHSHFSTAFLREFGITPSQFRLTATTRRVREMSRILKV